MESFRLIFVVSVFFLIFCLDVGHFKKYTEDDLVHYRDRVVQMFQHAYNGYLKYAYPLDELRPLTCDGQDTWGSYSLTLIDALDTLAVMGNYSEFQRVTGLLETTLYFDRDINVSVFETNIRVVGGLLSGHLLSLKAGVQVEAGWPCNGPLLRLAEKVARKLLPAFNTSTGMPYGTVNLMYGVPKGETPVTCTAGVGTFIVEFGALSQLTGLPIYMDTAMKALRSLWMLKSPIGLVGNHIDVLTGKWTALDSGIGAGVDSYFEYLVKGAILFPYPELLEMFNAYKQSITKYLKREDWYMWSHMEKGTVSLPIFQSLEAFWPGLLSLTGDIDGAMKTLLNYHQIWRQFGFLPEFYNIPKAEAQPNREGYPLRPELVESVMYLYQATNDPQLLDIAVDILQSIEQSTRTPCGHATVKNVRDHQLENRMESFFLAETTKYLYLIFDTQNFIHNSGGHGSVIWTSGGQCVVDAGGYVFNTEAHPIDAAALYCCSADRQRQLQEMETIMSDIDLLQLMGIDKEMENVVWKRRHRKANENPDEFEGWDEQQMMEKETEALVGKTAAAANVLVEVVATEPIIFNSSDSKSPSDDAVPASDDTESSETGESSSCQQKNPSLQVMPPPDDGQLQKPVPSIPLPPVDPVTAVPTDLWTFRVSINNLTEQEQINGLFTCPMRPFHARWSLMGEMFVDE